MKQRIVMCVLIICLLPLSTPWCAEIYGGNKIDTASKRLYIGGGAFSSNYCGKKLPSTILVFNTETAGKVGEIKIDGQIFAYSLGPSGNVAVIDNTGTMRLYGPDLQLLHTVKNVVASKESIYFDWNAAGVKLVYLGVPENEDIPYAPVRIFDLKTGTNEKIADKANSVRWAKFDGNIYYKIPEDREGDGWVYKYDVASKTSTKTKLLGVEFSADGAYYIGSRGEGLEDIPYYQIYDSTDNWVEPDADVDVEQVYKLGMYNHFLGNSHKVLTQYGAPISIFDIDTRKYVRPDMGLGLLGWSTDGSQLVFSDGECRVRIEDALTGQVIKKWTVVP